MSCIDVKLFANKLYYHGAKRHFSLVLFLSFITEQDCFNDTLPVKEDQRKMTFCSVPLS